MTTKVDVATENGFNVNFRYEIATGQTMPTTVYATANSISVNKTAGSPASITFNGEIDADTANAIVAECATILGEGGE